MPGTWIKDPPDPRDYIYKPPKPIMGRAAIAQSPTVVDNTAWLVGVLNQSGEGTCTGISSITGICGWAGRKRYYTAPSPNLIAGPRWAYNLGRWYLYDGDWTRGSPDYGCTLRACFASQQHHGILQEQYWPYYPTIEVEINPFEKRLNNNPYGPLVSTLTTHKNSWIYVRVAGTENIKSAIAEGYIIAMGSPWPKSWDIYYDTVLPVINTGFPWRYGHAYALYGYNMDIGGSPYFMLQNSFGLDWPELGLGGRAYMPMQAIDMFEPYYDAWIVADYTPPPPPLPPTPGAGMSIKFYKNGIPL